MKRLRKDKINKALLFIVLVLALGYLLVAGYFLLGGKWEMPGALVISTLYMFTPALAAIIVQSFIYKQPWRKPLGVSLNFNWWFLAAWLLPCVFALATLGVSLLLPGIEYSPEMEGLYQQMQSAAIPSEQAEQIRNQLANLPVQGIWLMLVQSLIAGATINTVVAFGEELGWRGLLHKELSFLGFWQSSWIIGLVWGLWHAPLIMQGHNYPQHPVIGVGMMVIFTSLMSPLFSYIRSKTQSVIAATIMHGSINATGGLALLFIKGGNDLTIGITGLAGLIVLASLNLVLLMKDSNLSPFKANSLTNNQ